MSSRRRNRTKRPIYEYYYSQHPDPREVVLGLLNGVDIILVDPQLFPSLIEPLNLYRERYEKEKQPATVERIDFWLDYIEKYPERQKIAEILMRKPKPPKPKPKPFTDDDLHNEVDSIIKNDVSKAYSYEQCQQIIGEIRSRRSELIEQQHFAEANMYDDRLKKLITVSETAQTLDMTRQKEEELQQKVKEAQEQLDDITERWNKVVENFKKERRNNLEQLAKDQDEEYRQKAEELSSKKPKALPSAPLPLLELRRREEMFLTAKKYAEAAETKNEIEQYIYDNQPEFQNQWDANTQLLLDQLVKKQDNAYKVRVANFKREETDLKIAMNKEIKSAQQKLKALQEMLQKTKDDIDQMDPSRRNQITENAKQKEKPVLPPIKTGAVSNEAAPMTFRRRALLNMKIYTRKPPKTARASKRARV